MMFYKRGKGEKTASCLLPMLAAVLLNGLCFAAAAAAVPSQALAAGKKPGRPVVTEITADSRSGIRIRFQEAEGAKKYYIYRATSRNGRYERIGACKKTGYTDRTGKVFTTYYYKITAAARQKGKWLEGKASRPVHATVRKKAERIAYAGDSIMQGCLDYGFIRNSSSARVAAKVGVACNRYYYECLGNLVSFVPDRLFIMLGANALENGPSYLLDNQISYYKKILNDCLKKNPHMEIIVVGVAPTRPNADVPENVRLKYNEKLRAMVREYAKKYSVYYCSLDEILSDSYGRLAKSYSAGDGYHWQLPAYRVVLKYWRDYVKELK